MGVNDFVLTENRDEKGIRSRANPPKIFSHNHLNVIYPQDTKSLGTWIASSENGFSLCLLNGGFTPHKSKPPYRKSRGLVLLDFFQFNNVNQYVVNYDFKGIEPFTLIILEYKSSLKLYEVRWDGKQVHLSFKNHKVPNIWSSVTLYNLDIIKEREKWFSAWKREQNRNFSPESIKTFHQTAGTGDKENDFMMRRENTLTVSITQIIKRDIEIEMNYTDCLKGGDSILSLSLS